MRHFKRYLSFLFPLVCLFSVPSRAQTAQIPLQCADVSGSGTAQSCATVLLLTPSSGDAIIYKTTTANTGDVTLNVDSTGAKHIRKWLGSSVLASGDLPANVPVLLIYDGTFWEIFSIGNAPSGGGSGAFSSLTPSTNTSTAGSFIYAPGSAIGGTTANWSFTGATAETDTAPVVQVGTASGSQQSPFSVNVTGVNALQILWITGGNQQTVSGFCATQATTGDLARLIGCFGTAGITGFRELATSTSFTGVAIQAETASAAGSGYKLFSGRVGCSADGTCAGGGAAEVFSVLGNGTINLGAAGSQVGEVNFFNATSGNLALVPATGALGTVTVTIPAATDTLVNLAGVQTLTNKNIAGSEITSGVVGAQFGGTGQASNASTGVAQVASGTWSFSTSLANGTTATTQTTGDNTTKVATDAFVLANIGGNVIAAPQFSTPYYFASGTANTVNGVSPPAVQGQYDCGYFLTTSAAIAPSCPQVGFGGGQDLTGSSTALTVAYSDNGQIVRHIQSASGIGAIALPTPTVLNNANFGFKYCNDSAQTDVITPTTLTIQAGMGTAGATLNVFPGVCYFIVPDPNAPTTNWVADSSISVPVSIANGGINATSSAAGTVPNATSSSAASWTATPILGVDNTTAGTLQMANGSSNAHTIWGSAATTSNTIKGFVTAPVTGDVVSCTTASTTCTLTDSGVLASAIGTTSTGGLVKGVLTGSITTAATPTGTQFLPLGGASVITGTEASAQQTMPFAGTITGLFARVSVAEGGAATLSFTVRKCTPSSGVCTGSSQALTCTIPNSGLTCNDTTGGHAFTFAQGDFLDVTTVQSGTGTAQLVYVSASYTQ